MSSAPVPPQRGNNAVWWILGIVGGGIALLVFLGLILAGVIVRHIHVSETGNKVKIETPVGELRVNKGELHATGLPVYPGAIAVKDKGATIQLSAENSGVGIAAGEYHTNDSLEKVQAWYRNHLGPEFRLEKGGDSFRLAKRHPGVNDSELAFVDDKGDGARVVALKKSGDGTDMDLVRVGKRETQ
jgi:hypothetical protein